MTSRSSFAYTAPLVAAIAGVHWLADVARVGYGIPVRSGPMVWGTVGLVILVVGAIGAWRGARWAPEVWLLGLMTLFARVGYTVFFARKETADVSPTRWVVVFGIWLAMAVWACRHAWVARQAHGRARALIAVTLILLGCRDRERPVGPVPLFPFDPIASVAVYNYPPYVQVGDTLHIEAAGYNRSGWSSRDTLRTVEWRSAPAGVVALEALSPPFRYMTASAARGFAPGRAIVTATLNGVTGSDSVVVLPHLQAVELSTDRTTVHVGDTVTFAAVIRTASGATLEGLRLVWELSDHTRASFTGAGDRVVAKRTGTVEVMATIARMTGRTTLTILPATTP